MSPLRLHPSLCAALLLLAPLGCSSGGGAAASSGGAPVPAAPTAAFTFTPAEPVAGKEVAFQDTSSGTPTTWAWDFGDGGTSTLRNPLHTFAAAGTYTVTLGAGNAAGSTQASRSLTVKAAATAPVAAFTFSPSNPLAGQTVTFADASTGSPTSWAWDFGDGATSTLQNPLHSYATAGTFTVSLAATSAGGTGRATQTVVVAPVAPGTPFTGTVLLGAPTTSGVKAKVFSADQGGTVFLQYGAAGAFDHATEPVALVSGTPLEIALGGLTSDTRYTYRLVYTASGSGPSLGAPGAFHTARPAGSTYTFTVQADSHMDENSDRDLYLRALGNALADAPDFHIDLGDTFMCEKHGEPLSATSPPAADAATVEARYRFERTNFATLGYSAPLFLVNGNHDAEAGWFGTMTASCLPVWATQSRQRHFVAPVPDGFYTGDTTLEPFVGQRGTYYAWTWGDALFVVLDPFWNSRSTPNKDAWALTLGDRQYAWLTQTLAGSKAPFKFIFIHNLVGGLDGQMRGGIEAAPYFEWGGKNLDGTNAFAAKRPGWAMPLHDLFKAHGVTAVFHGHDHLYAKQELDGIVYQEVPQPSAKNFQSGPGLATEYHYTSGTILSSSGHLRLTVAPDHVTCDYVRVWLPSQEGATRKNAEVAHSWTVKAASAAPVAAFTFTPSSPAAAQPVQFSDATAGSPTAWVWTFGDGTGSTAQHPSHTYASAGTYTVTLLASNPLGSSSATRTLTVTGASVGTGFTGDVVLGCPTASAAKATLYSASQSGIVVLAYGAGAAFDRQTAPTALVAGTPLTLTMEGLPADAACSYRVSFQSTGASGFTPGEAASFRTARASGRSFTFCLQGDSHPEREKTQFDPDLYRRTLQTAAADQPDFYLCMGDDFSVDTLDPATVTEAKVRERYTIQRPYLGLIGKSAPVFLVNGNHEQAARYLLDGTPNNVAVWAQNARNSLYAQPAPDAFYSGNPEVVPFVGLLRNTFAWTWGDALFVVIDPYWGSPVCVDNPFDGGDKRSNLWDITHGDAQFAWLKAVLEGSTAKWKFVFAHHVMGTGRGGVELATLYEWGGYDPKGGWLFPTKRPTWSNPIHKLMAANQVTVFFQGHDHIWVRQQLDGVTYQTLPEPADPTYSLFNSDAFATGDKFPNTGYTRVTVAPEAVKVDYVRTWLPKDEGAGKTSGSVAFTYTIR